MPHLGGLSLSKLSAIVSLVINTSIRSTQFRTAWTWNIRLASCILIIFYLLSPLRILMHRFNPCPLACGMTVNNFDWCSLRL